MGKKERKKEVFYLTTHSTYFIYGYIGVSHMVKDHKDNERKPAAATQWSTPTEKAARDLLYVFSHRQDSTHHGLCYTIDRTLQTMAFVIPVPGHWLGQQKNKWVH